MVKYHIYGDRNCPCPRCKGANPAYLPTLHSMLAGDGIDYRAMMAREVIAERTWRMWQHAVTPRELVQQEMHDYETTRVRVERINGEPL